MSKLTNHFSSPQISPAPSPLPSFPSREAVEKHIRQQADAWMSYQKLSADIQQKLVDFCMGKQGLKITYDTVFQKIFSPSVHPERIESLLSAILGHPLRIIDILPREGTRMKEQASFVIMDVLVRLNDGSYANVEMQKVGYHFPLARADCYAADIIMRQYVHVREEQGEAFSFQNMQKVYCIILMEKSPKAFLGAGCQYVHKRTAVFDTGIFPGSAGLHEDIFICLDSFRSIVHTITKESSLLDAWLTFLSATEPELISSLVGAFPYFSPIYQEISDFTQNPKELMYMLSEALYIMDKNMERLMVTELQEELAMEKNRADMAEKAEKETAEKLNAANEQLQKLLKYAKAHGYKEEI